MKKTLLIICFATIGFIVKAQTTGDYQSVTTGSWSTTTTWARFDGMDWIPNPATAPNSSDGVISILSGHTVTVNTAVTADQIVVDAGATLTQTSNLTLANGSGDDLTVNGTWNWQSGTIVGPGIAVVAVAGTLTMAGAAQKSIAADITSNGTINWQDGTIRFVAAKVVINNGAMAITGNSEMDNAVLGCNFENNGTITKTSIGTTTFSIPTVNNIGTFNNNAGITRLGNGFSNSTFNNTGNLTLNNSTFTVVSGGCTFNHNTGSVISGTGNFNHSAGILNLNINLVFPATLVFTSTGTINGEGNLTINHDFTIQGSILGAGSFTVVGNITWNIGLLTRILTIDAGSTLTFATVSQKSIAANITNNGTMNWQDGTIRYEGFAIVTNNGLMNITGNNNFEYAIAGSTFINNGTITKSSTGTTQLDIPILSNIGTFNCNAGTLINFSTNFTNTGSLNLSGSTFNNGPGRTFNHNTGSVISGSGNFNNNGTINFNINQVFPASIIFSSDNTIAGVGDLTINNDFTIQGNVSGGNLTINANTIWVGTNLSRIFTNQAGRTFTISGAGKKNVITNITNNGTMDWQGGTMRYEGPATITNNGLMTISGNNNFEFAISGVTLINNGTITKTSTGTTQLDIPFINNNGTFNCNAGLLLNYGNTFTNTGSLALNGGTFTLDGGRTFSNNTGGVIKGNGTVTMNGAFNSNGIIAPGLSPGKLTLNGAQPFSANTTLQIELMDGSGEGIGHDLLERAGNLTLAGTITVTETGSVPVDTYTIINLTSGVITGNFTTKNLPVGYTLQINSTNVQLVKAGALPLNLLSFLGKSTENGNELTWKTTNETNFSHFEIQRSEDAKKFEKIGKVDGNNEINYQFNDWQAPLLGAGGASGGLFYRLKLVDLDGKFNFSKIIRVENETKFSFSVYPNPVIDDLNISANVKELGNYQIQILNETGQEKSSETRFLKAGQNLISIPTNSFQKGLYFAVIQGDMGLNKVLKFIK